MLSRSSPTAQPPASPPGSSSSIQLPASASPSSSAIPLRRGLPEGGSGLNIQLDGTSAVPIIEQLAEALAAHHARVIEVFREWDGDGSGTISKAEFRQGLSRLGLRDVTDQQAHTHPNPNPNPNPHPNPHPHPHPHPNPQPNPHPKPNQADDLFDEIDVDRSGEIEYRELHSKLRRRQELL